MHSRTSIQATNVHQNAKFWKTPTNSQFVGALAVTTLVLVCTSVVMTQKPPWMIGKEEDLVKRSASLDGDTPLNSQLKSRKGRWQILASANSPTAASLGKLAVDEAAAHPGGLQHLDDYYVPILRGSVQPLKVQESSDVDKKVPVRTIKSEVYPLLGGYSEISDDGTSATEEFGHQLESAGLDNKGVETSNGGHGLNEAPFSRGVKEAVGADTRWAMYIAVFVVLLGLVLLLAYYLLPQNAFQRSFWEDWTEEHDPQTYYPDIAPRAKAGDSVRSGSGFPQVRQEGPGRYEMAAPAMPPAPTTATILA